MSFKETDIRPDHLVEGQLKYIDADRQRLLDHSQEFIDTKCPACDSGNSEKCFEKDGLIYVTCQNCDTLYVNPRPTAEILEYCYSKSEVYEYWNKYIFPVSEEERRKHIFQPRVKRISDICSSYGVKNARLMEVGAGYGTFCEEALKSGSFRKVIAVEPTPYLAETCRNKGLEVIEKPIERVVLEPNAIDVVCSFEVIEHLFCPGEFISSCASQLSPGGLIIISCPNVKGFDLVVLGHLSGTIDHEHLNYFNPKSLTHLVTKNGFDLLEIITPGELDAEIVRKEILAGKFDVLNNPFLKQILIDEWDTVGNSFQRFLSNNGLSSHMWLVGRKRD